MRRATVVPCVSVCLAFMAISASAQDPQFASVRREIARLMAQSRVPSVAVAVAKNGAIVWEEAFGFADRERRIPATAHTMYSLASVTKPMTATGIMVLVERGLIDLEKPISEYVGAASLHAYEGDASDATVKRVLLHTAGLPMHWNHFFDGDVHARPSMDSTLSSYGVIVAPPGDRYEYSNLGYALLEYAIERVTGRTYEAFMRAEVFEPLGMHDTRVVIEELSGDHVAKRYIENKATSPFYDHDTRGASSIYASAHDLVRFGMFHIGELTDVPRPVIGRQSIDSMQWVVDPLLPEASYRLGWSVTERFGYRRVSHGGGMPGVRTHLLLIPAERLAVAVLCNGPYIDPERIAESVLMTVIPEYAARRRAATRDERRTTTAAHTALTGTWAGEITTHGQSTPVQISFEEDGAATMIMTHDSGSMTEPTRSLGPVSYDGEFVSVTFPTELTTQDAMRFRHRLFLKLRRGDGMLSGFAAAESFREAFCLSGYIRLTRAASAVEAWRSEPAAESHLPPTGSLRAAYSTVSWIDAQQMLREKGLFDRYWNPTGDFENEFELSSVDGDAIVVDHRAGLMWYPSGSRDFVTYEEAEEWISRLNAEGYAGHHDWRMPTVEEAASLLESTRKNRGMYIDPLFERDKWCIWTGDRRPDGRAWVVVFSGRLDWSDRHTRLNYARAVRSQ